MSRADLVAVQPAPQPGVSGWPGSRAVPGEVVLLIGGHRRWAARRGASFGTALVLGLSRLSDALALLRREGVARVTVLTDSEDLWAPCAALPAESVALLTRHLLEEALTRLASLGIGLTVCAGDARLPASLHWLLVGHAEGPQGHSACQVRLVVNDADLGEPPDTENQANTPGAAATCLVIRSGGTPERPTLRLWDTREAAHYFTEQDWPDLEESTLRQALAWYQLADRRAGVLVRGAG